MIAHQERRAEEIIHIDMFCYFANILVIKITGVDMSLSVAACVKEIINRSPFISEMMSLDLISFSNLARFLKPKVEAMYGKSVNEASIVMAARRYARDVADESALRKESEERIGYEISMKTNIYDVNLRRSDESARRLVSLYGLVCQKAGVGRYQHH